MDPEATSETLERSSSGEVNDVLGGKKLVHSALRLFVLRSSGVSSSIESQPRSLSGHELQTESWMPRPFSGSTVSYDNFNQDPESALP